MKAILLFSFFCLLGLEESFAGGLGHGSFNFGVGIGKRVIPASEGPTDENLKRIDLYNPNYPKTFEFDCNRSPPQLHLPPVPAVKGSPEIKANFKDKAACEKTQYAYRFCGEDRRILNMVGCLDIHVLYRENDPKNLEDNPIERIEIFAGEVKTTNKDEHSVIAKNIDDVNFDYDFPEVRVPWLQHPVTKGVAKFNCDIEKPFMEQIISPSSGVTYPKMTFSGSTSCKQTQALYQNCAQDRNQWSITGCVDLQLVYSRQDSKLYKVRRYYQGLDTSSGKQTLSLKVEEIVI